MGVWSGLDVGVPSGVLGVLRGPAGSSGVLRGPDGDRWVH